jgi:hypothetical protein
MMGAGLGVEAATRYPSSFPNNESGALFFGGDIDDVHMEETDFEEVIHSVL